MDETKRDVEHRGKADDKKTASARALVPNAEGNVMVEAIMGPYRGQHLTMTAADGQGAINDHWARDPSEAIYEHEPLDDADRQHAIEAAHTWAQAQWDAAQGVPPDPPPPEGGEGEGGVTRGRDMAPNRPAPGYATRSADQRPAPLQQQPPQRKP